MKMVKRLVSLFAAALMLSAMPSSTVSADNKELSTQKEYAVVSYDELINRKEKPGEKAFGLLSGFFTNKTSSINVESNIDPEYSDFWDYFGGSYIDENGNLVVYTTKEYDNLAKAASIDENTINFVKTDYTYEELKEQHRDIWKTRNDLLNSENDELSSWARKIISTAVSQKNNCVTVFVNGFDENDYAIFADYFSGKKYRFETTDGDVSITPEVTVKPGQGLSIGSSVGFRCKYKGNKGFVTALHTDDYSDIGTVKNSSNTKLGEIKFSVFDGSADFCFVETLSGVSTSLVTNTTPSYTLNSFSSITYLPEGYTVYLAGANTSSASAGKVISFDYSIDKGDSWCVCDYSSTFGDSGGCVFAKVDGVYCVLGVHDGRVSSAGIDIGAYITKFSTMQEYYSDLQFYS